MNSVQPNSFVGLNSDKIDDPSINPALFRFLAGKKEAPVPTGSVGRAGTMRERILQLSIFPDIYDKRGKLRNPGNVDFGEPHKIKSNE
jgi:hypothetical protein